MGWCEFPSPSRSCASIHLSRKRARNEESIFLARLRERWRAKRDGEGNLQVQHIHHAIHGFQCAFDLRRHHKILAE